MLLKGHYGLLGATTGSLKVVLEFEDLTSGRVKIEEDDILCTVKTSNYFNPFLVNLKGIVTLEGSSCSHPMLIGRERHLPVVCGIPGGNMALLQQLEKWNGMKVNIRAVFLSASQNSDVTGYTGRIQAVLICRTAQYGEIDRGPGLVHSAVLHDI